MAYRRILFFVLAVSVLVAIWITGTRITLLRWDTTRYYASDYNLPPVLHTTCVDESDNPGTFRIMAAQCIPRDRPGGSPLTFFQNMVVPGSRFTYHQSQQHEDMTYVCLSNERTQTHFWLEQWCGKRDIPSP